jgi:hypothetical protein
LSNARNDALAGSRRGDLAVPAISVPAPEIMNAGRTVGVLNRIATFQCSGASFGKGIRTGFHRQSIQKIFERVFSGLLCRVVGSEAAFPQPHSHGPSLAAYFPAPRILIVSGNDNVE